MEDFKISVLITFYNQEKYVDDCLKSVFSQKTEIPFKVIVGDDGSTDGTSEKLRLWQEKYPARLSVLVMPREEGVNYVRGGRASRNRLALLQKVDTKYFHYLDGDDYWTDDEKLQIEYDILEKPENMDCVGCAHSIGVYREENMGQGRECWGNGIKSGKYSLNKYWRNMYFHTDTILFRSEYISKLSFDLLKEFFNDNIITFCFMQFGSMYFIDRCMADYRQNNNGIWVGESETIGIIREFMMYDLELKINPNIKSVAMQRHMRDFVYFYANREKFTNFEEYYRIAKEYDLHISKRILEDKYIFIKNCVLDRGYIFLLKIYYCIVDNWARINEIGKK